MTMQKISDRFIPIEEVRRLTIGSYEHLIARLEEAVRKASTELFGAQVEARIVGTFPGYAIALAEDGRFIRLKYEDSKGIVQILAHESVTVSSYAPDELDVYLKNEAKRAVDSFVLGDVQGGIERLRAITPFVERKAVSDDYKIVEALTTFHRSDRPWRKVFHEKSDRIRRIVLDEIAAIHNDRLQIRFRSLYSGSVSEADLDGYRELVIEHLANVGQRASALADSVSSAVHTVKESRVQDKDVVVSLLAFAEDLIEDLQSVKKAVSEAPQRIKKVDCLGRLHDMFAEDFHEREQAGQFVVKMSQRLIETNP